MNKKLFLLYLILGNYAINCGELAELEEGRRNSTHQENNIDLTTTPSPLPPAANSEASNSHNSEVLQQNNTNSISSQDPNHCRRFVNPCIAITAIISVWLITQGLLTAFQVYPFCTEDYRSCSSGCGCNPVFQFRETDVCPEGYNPYVTIGSPANTYDIYNRSGELLVNASYSCQRDNFRETIRGRQTVMRYLGCQNNCGQNIDYRATNTNETLRRCCRRTLGEYRLEQRAIRHEVSKKNQPQSRGRGKNGR